MTMNDYLDFLAGHVFDHDKLVTYKWLSKELEVHVNVAKQMLWEFYEKYRENGNIECTYLLIGTLKDSGIRVEVVRESNLSKAKEKFSKIISEHLYSVHKPLQDLELLATSGTSGDVRFSAIKCDACIEHNDEEIYRLRWGATAKFTEEKTVNSKPVEPVNKSKIDKKPVVSKKNGFNNFFSAAGKQKSSETSETSKTEKDKEFDEKSNDLLKDIDLTEKDKDSEKNKSLLEKSKGTTSSSKSKKTSPKTEETNKMKKGGLESFFEKMSSAPKPTEVKVPEEKEEEKEEVKVPEEKEEEKEEIKASEKKKEEVMTSEKKKEVSETKKVKEKEKPRGKKRIRSQSNNNTAKKRKRIMVQSDSSDSEAQSDTDVEEPMPDAVVETEAPTRPKSPSPPTVKHENGKRKVLKMISKTYKDDSGFIVTKKVHVYVSCSEDEEEKKAEEEKKKEKEKEKEKAPPSKKGQAKIDNAKKKQTVLTNFFNKAS